MFCLQCRCDYRPGFTECADCGLIWAVAPTAESATTTTRLVTVFASADPALIALALSLLKSAGIPFSNNGKGMQELFGVFPVEFLVDTRDAEEARLVVKNLQAGS